MVSALHSFEVMKSFLFASATALALVATSSLARADNANGCTDDGVCVAAPAVYQERTDKHDEPVSTHMRSIPVFVTGIVFDVIGGAATAAGVGLLVASPDCRRSEPTTANGYTAFADYGCGVSSTLVDLAGIGALTGGAIFLAIGIPLTVSGARSVPDEKKASAVPTVRVGANGGSLTWKF